MERNTLELNRCAICEKEFDAGKYKSLKKYCSKDCIYISKRMMKTNKTKEELMDIHRINKLYNVVPSAEREKLRLKIKTINTDHKAVYIKNKKNNPRWKALKKISGRKHYLDNKEYYQIYNKIHKKLGIAPRIRDIREDPEKFRKMAEGLK